jgi:predicted XRE-type DNA-binding protein
MKNSREQHGADNVLVDLGFPDAEELTAKTILAKKVNDIIDSRMLTQTETASILRVTQSKVSAIRNYRLRAVSLERLMLALTALGQHVAIVITPSDKEAPARIEVAA